VLFSPFKWFVRIAGFFSGVILLYFVVTLAQVWLTSTEYAPRHAGAIMVMGAAQYNGKPSPDLRARLKEALLLFKAGDAPLIMVTGGKELGDVYTEAEAGAMYLELYGVPAQDILQAGGRDSYENIAEAAPQLVSRGVTTVLVTTDPFHEYRSMAITSSFKLVPSPTPTHSSPISGWATVPYFLKEAVGVGFGRIIGYNHLEWLHAA
jgi:uncharacterized SAM-binding protein YcdF (DUF218 family)